MGIVHHMLKPANRLALTFFYSASALHYSSLVGEVPKAPTTSEDQALMRNIDSLEAREATGQEPSLDGLRRELKTLWARNTESEPLELQVVFSQSKDGYKTVGMYLNAYKGLAGQDSIFLYYHSPEKEIGRAPAYIDLTGGGGPERGLWLARTYKCAVADVEWRGTKNQFRSQWQGCDPNAMKGLTKLRDNPAFRLIYGVRRVIDYLEQQPNIDPARLGCGGGSMGGYYSLLAAGVDARVKFVMDELGAGCLAQSDSSLGQFKLSGQKKDVWLQAFDPSTYAFQTKARMIMNLSANDYFFWLDNAIEHYGQIAGEKRLCITPNFNHNDGAFGKKKGDAMKWLNYGLGNELDYPNTPEVTKSGSDYNITTGSNIVRTTLCWSPGGNNIVAPARYWVEIPATGSKGCWKVKMPFATAGLAHMAFVNAWDSKGRMISSLPMTTAGTEIFQSSGLTWAKGSLWDIEAGVSAWRQVGPNVHRPAEGTTLRLEGEQGLLISPSSGPKPAFSLVTNSVILVAGSAKSHLGLKLNIDGLGESGNLNVSLVRNFGAASQQREHVARVSYLRGCDQVELPWGTFKQSLGESKADLLGFDSLRLDGDRPSGNSLLIKSIEFIK